LSNYLDAYLITGDTEFLDAVHDIATYLTTSPMQSSSGGFFSSEDADSVYSLGDTDKREGAFYVWTATEFIDILGPADAEIAARFWNVKASGNVSPEHDAHDELQNQNVLAVSLTVESLAEEFDLTTEETQSSLDRCRRKLLEHREKQRPRPALDDKIIVAWNGLAISSLSRVSAAIGSVDPEKANVYLQCAIRAAEFIKKELYSASEGTLTRVYREGPGNSPAFSDDYAFLVTALIDLYEATFDDAWLEWADALQKKQIELFLDTAGGAFFSTAEDQSDLILRLKDGMDNAEPSTNGVAASNLSRLSAMLEDDSYASLAKSTVQAFEAETMQHPFLFPGLLDTAISARLGMCSVVIGGEGDRIGKAVQKMRNSVNSFRTVVRLGGGAQSKWLVERNRLLGSIDATDATIQLCENKTCRMIHDDEIL